MSTTPDFQVCEPLFTANEEAVHPKTKKKCKVVVNQGGTSSAKTYTIMQVLHKKAATIPNLVITVVGQDVPNLKKGAIRDSMRIIGSSPFLQARLHDYKNTRGFNKTERIHEYKNGSIIEFNSYDNEQDAKSGKRDYLFINEANGISYEIYFQLSIRTRVREYLDYNPSARFWVHDKIIPQEGTLLLISDHRHNRFLSQEQHDEIENIADDELWRVYARGMTGAIHGLIYPKYRIIETMPTIYEPVYGLDFGYNHKTALVEVMKDPNRLFFNEMIYQSELTIGDLIVLMKDLRIGRKPVYADHAAPDKIEDLKRAGFNVHKADKDVKNGIDFVKRHLLHFTKKSKGLLSEAGTYKFKTKDGLTLDEPVKFRDDGLDASRYGAYTGFRKPKGIKIADDSDDDDYWEGI